MFANTSRRENANVAPAVPGPMEMKSSNLFLALTGDQEMQIFVRLFCEKCSREDEFRMTLEMFFNCHATHENVNFFAIFNRNLLGPPRVIT